MWCKVHDIIYIHFLKLPLLVLNELSRFSFFSSKIVIYIYLLSDRIQIKESLQILIEQ